MISMMEESECVFGFPDFWSKAYLELQSSFNAITQDLHLAKEMFNASHPKLSKVEHIVVYTLVSLTVTGMHELLILAGNGAGVGAMKIARGMFEMAVMAEYLRTHAAEMNDYADFRHVILWNRMQDYPEIPTAAKATEIEDNFNRVRPRFENKKGKVRNHWNRHSIAEMADAVGRKQQYEKVYRIAASMHHGNSEAFLSHAEELADGKTTIVIDDLPSMEWVLQALVSGHVYVLQALGTFNEFMQLGFEEQIDAANLSFQDVWKRC